MTLRFCRLPLLSGLLFTLALPLYASPLTQSNPMTDCLNSHILSQYGSDAAPDTVVNQAFLLCRPFTESWLKGYPPARRQQLERALRQFYLDRLNAALIRR